VLNLLLISAVLLRGPEAALSPQTTVVLVHGAWADGSSWSKVIPLLQSKCLRVISVQNPLTSLADDVTRVGMNSRTAPEQGFDYFECLECELVMEGPPPDLRLCR
jgi:hypothetical protein